VAIAANAPAPRQATPAPETATDFAGIQPVRVLDTRNAAGGPIGIAPGHKLGAGESIDVAVAGVGAIPEEATSVAINITIDEDATLKSFLTVWSTGQTRPNTSANNAEPGLVSSNSAIFQLGTGGQLSVFNQQGAVNVIMDVTGYFIAGEVVPTTTTSTTAAAPTPTLSFSDTSAPGGTVFVTGYGWVGCGPITVEATPHGTGIGGILPQPTTVYSNSGGALTGSFTAPVSPDTYTITVTGTPWAMSTCTGTGTLSVI
jgi:hypothetical protein